MYENFYFDPCSYRETTAKFDTVGETGSSILI